MTYSPIILPNGVSWSYRKTPKFQTTVQTPRSGRGQVRYTAQVSPIWEWELTWNYLKEAGITSGRGLTTANDFSWLQDFYLSQQGAFGAFVFDPSQYNFERLSVTGDTTQLNNGFFATGDGSTTVFNLWRSSTLASGIISRLEMIQNVSLLTGIYSNGTLVSPSAYTLTNFPATVTFTSAPASGTVLSWAGSFNYLAHFADDSIDVEEFMYQLWSLKSLKLELVQL